MSGGGLSEYGETRLYIMDDWAKYLRLENPVLAELLTDLRKVLDAYDYYLAGDSGAERVERAWKTFSEKWLSKDLEKLKPIIMERCRELIDSLLTGHMREEEI